MPNKKPVLRILKGGLTRAQDLANKTNHPSRHAAQDKTEPVPGADRQRRPIKPLKKSPPVCMIPGCGCTGEVSHP